MAIAGYVRVAGRNMVFSDIKEPEALPKLAIWREAKKYMSQFKHAYCEVGTEHARAELFLNRLGFKPTQWEGLMEWHN